MGDPDEELRGLCDGLLEDEYAGFDFDCAVETVARGVLRLMEERDEARRQASSLRDQIEREGAWRPEKARPPTSRRGEISVSLEHLDNDLRAFARGMVGKYPKGSEPYDLARHVLNLLERVDSLKVVLTEVNDAWEATGVASTVRGLTTLADVVATHRRALNVMSRMDDALRKWSTWDEVYHRSGCDVTRAALCDNGNSVCDCGLQALIDASSACLAEEPREGMEQALKAEIAMMRPVFEEAMTILDNYERAECAGNKWMLDLFDAAQKAEESNK